jgi:hypothetical protein
MRLATSELYQLLSSEWGRAMAQAVSRQIATAETLARAQVKSYGTCGGQNGSGADFLRVLRFTLPRRIPPIAAHSSLSMILAK